MSERSVLIANGDQATRESLSRILIREGYKVETASLASEVIQKIQNANIGVLVIDVDLSGMESHGIIPIIKKIDPAIPIVVMSNNSSLELARRVRKEGIFYYALKPLDQEEIKLAVRDAFRMRRRK